MSNELLTQQQQAAASLLANGSMEKQAIAKYIGISRTTLYQWMKNDNFNAEVDRLKHEIKVFGQEIIAGKLAEAVSKYWNLIESTDNQRVKAEGYQYFINRNLGKPTSKLELEAGMKEAEVSDDILDAEFEEWYQEN
ncbi:MAG: helix-turn-helix domain-containing protein [Bacillaceae bacterium]|nr:helix-turn-helix domain-containing protein [Bacillaceae bacterium]